MNAIVYCTSLILISFTTFTLLSFGYVKHNDATQEIKPPLCSMSLPESTFVFCTIPIRILSNIRDSSSGVAIVRIEGNRLWADCDSIINIGEIKGEIKILCSFSDTGRKNIECLIITPNGINLSMNSTIEVGLPLKPSLEKFDAHSLVLVTSPVTDQVNYVWEFDNGFIVYANNPNIALPILERGAYRGKLYVECAKSRSPEVKFDFDKQVAKFNNICKLSESERARTYE